MPAFHFSGSIGGQASAIGYWESESWAISSGKWGADSAVNRGLPPNSTIGPWPGSDDRGISSQSFDDHRVILAKRQSRREVPASLPSFPLGTELQLVRRGIKY